MLSPTAPFGLAVLTFGASAAPQGGSTTLDLIPTAVQAIQSIQTGTTRLAAGRATYVRVPVRALGTIPPGVVYDGVLRVFDHGVEIPGSPFYSQNGPLVPVPLPDPTQLDGTLNFAFLPPESDQVVLEVEINPAGPTQVAELDYSNNVRASAAQTFHCRENGDIVGVPINYTFSVPPPNLPDNKLIKPGVGDAFVQAVYPPADFEYRRPDTGFKTWTQSLSSSFGGSELAAQLALDMQLMSPVPDFIYGWIPGALPGYNGVALSIPGVAAIGNTEPIRFQRTFAHELGHLHGLQHNSTTVSTIGIDVEHHLNETQSMPQLLPATQKDIMYAGLLTHEAWIAQASHNVLFDNAAYACTAAAETDAPPPARLLLSGLHDRVAGRLALTDALVIHGGRPSPLLAPEAGDLVMRIFDEKELLIELGLGTRTSLDSCPECRSAAPGAADSEGPDPTVGAFTVVLPETIDPARVARVAFVDPRTQAVLHELVRSERAPAARIDGVEAVQGGGALVHWSAAAADSGALSAYLVYSADGERRTPLSTGLTGTGGAVHVDAERLPALVPGQGYLELLVSDGLRTTTARWQPGPGEGTALGAENAPQAFVLTPDEGKSYPQGATVVLHASGYDVEDKFLDGASVVWTSSLDGAIGVGRVTSVADLSVGTHLITVTATDSAGLFSVNAKTITITPRDLPGLGTCQQDLGFGGPGASTLSVCGGDLSSGTSATIALAGAAPSAPLFLVAGGTSGALPLFGGTLVPSAPFTLVAGVADAGGAWSVVLQGGGGPGSAWVQAGYVDPAAPAGVGISNAVKIDLLP